MILELRGVRAGYGAIPVLHGIDLDVPEGAVVTLLGRNGMGKTTMVRTIMGLLAATAGSIVFEGVRVDGLPSHAIARLGIGLVPEGRQVFPNLSVREHLLCAAANRRRQPSPWTAESVLELFPALDERRDNLGSELSGGEQQMLAIGRALTTNPRLLILDEATEGLAPLVREQIWRCIALLRERGQAILLIDKNLAVLQRFADRHVVLEKGQVVWSGSSVELLADTGVVARHLGL